MSISLATLQEIVAALLFNVAFRLYSFTGNKSFNLPIAIAPKVVNAAVALFSALLAAVDNAGVQMAAL
jgi:hypothetical protein